jgi:hypothetical protein
MANKHKATISKIRWNHWRGYLDGVLDGVQTIEFENTATETAEQAAKRWLAAQNEPPRDRET